MLIKLRDVPQKKLLGSKIIATIRKKTADDRTISGYCEKVIVDKNNKKNAVIKTADGKKISIGGGALISLVQ